MTVRLVQVLAPLLAIAVLTTASSSNPHADKNRCTEVVSAGQNLYSDPDDCTKYFSCSNGVNIPMSCPSGLRFSNKYQTCAHPGSTHDTCETDAGTALPNPASPGSNSAGSSAVNPHAAKNECPQTPNAQPHMYADPDDCSKFYICSHGVNVQQSCPSGLLFSNDLKVCVHPGSSSDTCEIERAIKKCKAGYNGIIPHPYVCQRYFNCSDTSSKSLSLYRPFENDCIYPYIFDSVTGKCKSHRVATCSGISKPSKYICDYLYARCPVSHCMSCNVREANCVGLTDGFHAHSGRPNSPYYVRCEDGYSMETLRCPGGKIFSETNKCVS